MEYPFGSNFANNLFAIWDGKKFARQPTKFGSLRLYQVYNDLGLFLGSRSQDGKTIPIIGLHNFATGTSKEIFSRFSENGVVGSFDNLLSYRGGFVLLYSAYTKDSEYAVKEYLFFDEKFRLLRSLPHRKLSQNVYATRDRLFVHKNEIYKYETGSHKKTDFKSMQFNFLRGSLSCLNQNSTHLFMYSPEKQTFIPNRFLAGIKVLAVLQRDDNAALLGTETCKALNTQIINLENNTRNIWTALPVPEETDDETAEQTANRKSLMHLTHLLQLDLRYTMH